jgi:hypothetical protein
MCLVHVGKVDGSISSKLADEVAQLIFKVNLAYHMMLEDYGNDGIWDRLPAYFKDTRNQLKAKTHPIYHFLKSSENLVFGANLFIPLEEFKLQFNDHSRRNNLKRVPWTEELYMVPLADHQLRLERRKDVVFHEKTYSDTTVIVGVTWKNDNGHAQQTTLPNMAGLRHSSPDGAHKKRAPPQIGSYQAIPSTLPI